MTGPRWRLPPCASATAVGWTPHHHVPNQWAVVTSGTRREPAWGCSQHLTRLHHRHRPIATTADRAWAMAVPPAGAPWCVLGERRASAGSARWLLAPRRPQSPPWLLPQMALRDPKPYCGHHCDAAPQAHPRWRPCAHPPAPRPPAGRCDAGLSCHVPHATDGGAVIAAAAAPWTAAQRHRKSGAPTRPLRHGCAGANVPLPPRRRRATAGLAGTRRQRASRGHVASLAAAVGSPRPHRAPAGACACAAGAEWWSDKQCACEAAVLGRTCHTQARTGASSADRRLRRRSAFCTLSSSAAPPAPAPLRSGARSNASAPGMRSPASSGLVDGDLCAAVVRRALLKGVWCGLPRLTRGLELPCVPAACRAFAARDRCSTALSLMTNLNSSIWTRWARSLCKRGRGERGVSSVAPCRCRCGQRTKRRRSGPPSPPSCAVPVTWA